MNSIDFVTQLKGLIGEQINNIHTAIPGEIQSVDASAGTVTVQPKGTRTFSNGDTLDYPVLNNVPIIMPFTVNGDASIMFPVSKGDQCLLIFSEQALELWLGTGTIGPQVKYGLTGALCLPGLMKVSTDDFKEACNDNAVIIREGKTTLKLTNDGGVEVSTNGSVEVISEGDTKVDASGKVEVVSKGDTTVNATGKVDVAGSSSVSVSGNSKVEVSCGLSSVEVSSASAKLASGAGSITISSGGSISFSCTSVSGLMVTGTATGVMSGPSTGVVTGSVIPGI